MSFEAQTKQPPKSVSQNQFVGGIVDEGHPEPVDMVNIPLFAEFYTSQVVVWDFWTINSRTRYQPETAAISSSSSPKTAQLVGGTMGTMSWRARFMFLVSVTSQVHGVEVSPILYLGEFESYWKKSG